MSTNPLQLFNSHGIALEHSHDDQYIGQCPFCDGDQFDVNEKKLLWHCKHCGQGGNKLDFLKAIYEVAALNTTPRQRAGLEKRKHLPKGSVTHFGLALWQTTDEWLYPTFDRQKELTGLYRYARTCDPNIVFQANTFKHQLLNLHRLKPTGRVFIVEGHWDVMVWQHILDRASQADNVLAIPGASVFNIEWCQYLENRYVIVLHDNDEAGEGMYSLIEKRIKEYVGEPVLSLGKIEWPNHFPNKYDIKDHWNFVKQGGDE